MNNNYTSPFSLSLPASVLRCFSKPTCESAWRLGVPRWQRVAGSRDAQRFPMPRGVFSSLLRPGFYSLRGGFLSGPGVTGVPGLGRCAVVKERGLDGRGRFPPAAPSGVNPFLHRAEGCSRGMVSLFPPQFCVVTVPNQGVGRAGASGGLSRACRGPPPRGVLTWPRLCVPAPRCLCVSPLLFSQGRQPRWVQAHPNGLILLTLQRLQVVGLGFHLRMCRDVTQPFTPLPKVSLRLLSTLSVPVSRPPVRS